MNPELQAMLEALDDQQSAEVLAYLMNRNGGAQPDLSGGGPGSGVPTGPGGGH